MLSHSATVGRQWLLAHDRLAGRDAREHELGVRLADGRHEDRVDVVALDELMAVVEDRRPAEDRRDLLAAVAAHVT